MRIGDKMLIWSGRCFDHNFLRFLPIFGEKIGFFLQNQCYDQIFAKTSRSWEKTPIFRHIFCVNILRILTSGPDCDILIYLILINLFASTFTSSKLILWKGHRYIDANKTCLHRDTDFKLILFIDIPVIHKSNFLGVTILISLSFNLCFCSIFYIFII
jgi:hypothetical protein